MSQILSSAIYSKYVAPVIPRRPWIHPVSPPDPVNDPLESVGAASETSIRGREGAMAAAEMNRHFGNDHAGGQKFCQHALHTFIGPT